MASSLAPALPVDAGRDPATFFRVGAMTGTR